MLKESEKGCIFLVYARPGASKNEVSGFHGDRIKIKISAPPVDGEANDELIKYLAQIFDVSKSKVHLIRGQTSKTKDFLIELDLKTASERLGKFLS